MRKMFVALVAFLVGAIGGVVGATPAMAAESECTSPYICFWENAYYGGNMYKWSVLDIGLAPGGCVTFSSGINNKTSSIKGMHHHAVTFFDGAGGGANFARSTAFSDNNLGDSTGIVGWNNRISSICVLV